jgi:hypothetical protein
MRTVVNSQLFSAAVDHHHCGFNNCDEVGRIAGGQVRHDD